MELTYRLKIAEIIQRFGGMTRFADLVGANRTTIYRAQKRGGMPTQWLERLKSCEPDFSVDHYLHKEEARDHTGGAES